MTPEPGPAGTALLVCSPGGHLMQMLRLRPAWQDMRRIWITLEAADSAHLLSEEHAVLAHGPTNRSVRAFFVNLRLAWKVVRSERPDVILSTGAALAAPFFLVGKLYGAHLVYVESLTRINAPSLTGRLVYPLADAFFVQWPEAARWKRARYVGRLL
jgi:beta-1,4-N-acetylglucosaminyltransferase